MNSPERYLVFEITLKFRRIYRVEIIPYDFCFHKDITFGIERIKFPDNEPSFGLFLPNLYLFVWLTGALSIVVGFIEDKFDHFRPRFK